MSQHPDFSVYDDEREALRTSGPHAADSSAPPKEPKTVSALRLENKALRLKLAELKKIQDVNFAFRTLVAAGYMRLDEAAELLFRGTPER